MHIEVDILRRQVTYHAHNAGCFIRLNRVTYPGYVVYIISAGSDAVFILVLIFKAQYCA